MLRLECGPSSWDGAKSPTGYPRDSDENPKGGQHSAVGLLDVGRTPRGPTVEIGSGYARAAQDAPIALATQMTRAMLDLTQFGVMRTAIIDTFHDRNY